MSANPNSPTERKKSAVGRVNRLMQHVLRRAWPLAIPLAIGAAIWGSTLFASATTVYVRAHKETHPQKVWAACNRHDHSSAASTFKPLSDKAAAALVTREPEIRSGNAKPFTLGGHRYPATNYYEPTTAQLRKFRSARTSLGQPILKYNPYLAYVNGHDGLSKPSTDDLIQWAAHKWGIPENWLRAEYVLESQWSSWWRGDETAVSKQQYAKYPLLARIRGSHNVYQSLGITQERWDPKGDFGAGTEPLRWRSTSFNIDYQAAMVRFYYDNPANARAAWGDHSYAPCHAWESIGAWFSSYPFNNSGSQQYVNIVKHNLATDAWRESSFVHEHIPMPSVVKLR